MRCDWDTGEEEEKEKKMGDEEEGKKRRICRKEGEGGQAQWGAAGQQGQGVREEEVAAGAEFSFLDTRVFVKDRLHTVSWSYLFAIHLCKGNVAAEEKEILEFVSLKG
ncbi:hypothetical protein AXG93_1955s1010 [Marchantia polymorpha subsp. ruderalis]|uniref:Uncharacterized protein n=1 Tax=Marchantia polymorpha subsp. ruderalis TaxID=1480154 RepID=A0A176VZB2_MARPO|nr:hypothetical protein AXG93_1955s1010 [Marchantia polymorpha subsp. ruderalis]